jgi:ribonucleoside-diphosphate reductase alpha chain
MTTIQATDRNGLNGLGEKIFLDRYALKDMTRATLSVGDTVIVLVDPKTNQREVGTVIRFDPPHVTVELRDGGEMTVAIEHVDKPIETHPAQMMDRVARGIASIEKTPELRAEWESKFRSILDGFKFVPAGRILTAAGSDQKLTYYNCMPPGQEILTADGYKPIAEVKIGERVVTHRNRLRSVISRFERDTDEMLYVIKPKKLGFDALRVTGDHKILIIRSEWVNKHRSRDGLRLQQEPGWIPAKEIKVGDYVAVAYNAEECPPSPISMSHYLRKYELQDGKLSKPTLRREHGYVQESGAHFSLNDQLEVDGELCYLFGRWLGDGCVTHRSKTDIPSGIKIVFGLDEKDEAEHIAAIIERKFGLAASLKLSSTKRWYDLWVNSMPLGEFFKAFLGCYSYGKRIPDQLMQLPRDLALELVRGVFAADGYVSGQYIGIALSNRVLATQLHQILLRLGYLFSIRENTHRLGKVPAYRLTSTPSDAADLFQLFFNAEPPERSHDLRAYIEHDGLRWIRVDEIAAVQYRGQVMDIEVEEDHSFVSAGVVVSNCYVVPSPKDSRQGIMDTLTQMTEIMSRGGGVGINLSSLRPTHAYVKGVNGRSSGAVSWGALYSFVTGLIEQGGSRRGALMLILNDWHPDVFNFINSKRTAGKITNANISVGVSDALLDAVRADGDWDLVFPDTNHPDYNRLWDGDLNKWRAAGLPVIKHKTVKAREVWNSIIESAWASAEPGVFFNDRYNTMSNSWYFASIICTNPCTTGDTLVATEHGYTKARELKVGMNIRTPAGLKPIEEVYNSGVQRIHRVDFSDGGYLDCTADHKLKVVRGKRYEWVAVSNLRTGDKVLVAPNESFGSMRRLPEEAITYIEKRGLKTAEYYDRTLGFLAGVVIGDGTLRKVATRNSHSYQCKVAFGAKEVEWMEHFRAMLNDIGIRTHVTRAQKEIVTPGGAVVVHEAIRLECYKLATLLAKIGMAPNLKAPDKVIPQSLMTLDQEFLAGLLDGLFTTDGNVLKKADNPMLRFSTSSHELAQQVRLLLLQFGIHGRIYTTHRDPHLTYDGRSMVGTGIKYDVVIMNEGVARFYSQIGLTHPQKAARLQDIAENWHHIGGTWTASVVSVQDTGRSEEVFDVYEPNTLSWVTNGYVSFDCGEQGLPAWGVCNLAAINLAKFYDAMKNDVAWDELGRTVRYAVRFLDNVIDATPYFFDENREQQLKERRVGLNTMGLAELMLRLGIRYGSDGSVKWLDKLYEFIAVESYEASIDLAKERGPFPAFDAKKHVQSGYMQAMPQRIRDGVARYGVRNVTLLTQAPNGTIGTMVDTSTGIEPFFSWTFFRKSRLGLHEQNVAVVEEWKQAHPGQPLPDYFVTAMSLSPEEHIRVQAAIQRWVDSSISKTCNVPNDYTVEQVRALYELMYELGCKGGTIYRDGSRDEQVLMLKEEKQEPRAKKQENGQDGASAVEVFSKPIAAQPKVAPLPALRHGITASKHTSMGTLHLTSTHDEHGEPFEVFMTVGKAGSDLQADAEALGRLISLLLRIASPVSRKERLEMIVSQLEGIGGARSVGFGANRVSSMPDALAATLRQIYFGEKGARQLALPTIDAPASALNGDGSDNSRGSGNGEHGPYTVTQLNGHEVVKISGADMCPECGMVTLIRSEGCRKCETCGYSEC